MHGENHIEYTICNLCGSNNYTIYHEQQDLRYTATPRDTFHLVKCNECGLVYLNPIPSRTYMQCFYPDTFYDFRETSMISRKKSIKDFLGDLAPVNLKKRFALKEKMNAVKKFHKGPGTILDIGAAEGNFLSAMKTNGWKISGVEISKMMSDFAFETHGIQYINDDLNNLSIHDFKTRDFDIITMWSSLVHLYDLKSALLLCNRILKPGGKIIIMSNNADSWEERLFRSADPNLVDVPRHLYHINPEMVKKYFEVTGFKCVKIRHFTFNVTDRLTIILNSKIMRMRRERLLDKLLWFSALNLSVSIGLLFSLLLSVFRRSHTFTIIGMKQDA